MHRPRRDARPETDATAAQLMDSYVEVADWDLSTRKANKVYIRRVINPALGHLQVRKILGPLLDLLYAQLRRCSDPTCTGKRFTEHRNVPSLSIDPASRRPGWQQVSDAIRELIRRSVAAARVMGSVRGLYRAPSLPDLEISPCRSVAMLTPPILSGFCQGRLRQAAAVAWAPAG